MMREPSRRIEKTAKSWPVIQGAWFFMVGLLVLGAAVAVADEGPAASPAGSDPEIAQGTSAEAASESAESSTVGISAEADDAAWMSGLWVFVDPVTGQFRSQPTAEQEAWRRSRPGPNSSLNKSSEGLVPFELEGGGRGVHLDGRFRHALVVTVNGDGSFAATCADHPLEVAGHGHGEVATDAEAPVR